MRYIIYGAGAVGGLVGAGLRRAGEEVMLIARGKHLEMLRAGGLTIAEPRSSAIYEIPAVGHPAEIEFGPEDIVVLTMKTQDTLGALEVLSGLAPVSTPIVCAQNGVENERLALRFFEHVYGICVVGGAAHLEPGVVLAESGPVFGSLDLGRYPRGLDTVTSELAAGLSSSWVMFEREAVMRWKYTKLLRNLVLAVQALCGPNVRQGRFFDVVRAEGEACLQAAGIDFANDAEWKDARASGPEVSLPREGRTVGGSSWQSLARHTGSIETAYLNGEILLLARTFGLKAPANAVLYELGLRAAADGSEPGGWTEDELFAELERRS